MKGKILIIEDQKPIASAILKGLKNAGFAAEIADDGLLGMQMYRKHKPILIILDIILPKKTGTELLQNIRAMNKTIPIIMLSTKDEIKDISGHLDMGADDYVGKPFHIEELVSRVRAHIRRVYGNYSKKMHYKDIVIDTENQRVKRDNKTLDFSRKEYLVLKTLIENVDKPLTREEIISNVWKKDPTPSVPTVDVHINRIRNLLNKRDRHAYIRTAHGVGYVVESGA